MEGGEKIWGDDGFGDVVLVNIMREASGGEVLRWAGKDVAGVAVAEGKDVG